MPKNQFAGSNSVEEMSPYYYDICKYFMLK